MATNSEPSQSTEQQTKGHASQVAKHYNELQEGGLVERAKSRIFYMRNFNNWIKSMAIAKYLDMLKENMERRDRISVLDLCSGKGGDLLKWKKGGINSLVCADIAGTSVEQSEGRYTDMLKRAQQERRGPRLFSAQFITADCSKARLKSLYQDQKKTFDLVSCQFSFHYSFESYHQADMMLRNACECLRPGGYFIGTTPNANELVKRLRASDDMSFGNDVYRVTFKTEDKTGLDLFGCEYDFHLEGVVNCPEFLVHMPLLKEMAERYGMELVECTRFDEFFDQQIEKNEGRGLIGHMQALEPYPADDNVELMGTEPEDYSHVQARLTSDKSETTEDNQQDNKRKFGTLSQAEWEAITVYLFFAFRKTRDVSPEYSEIPQSSQGQKSSDEPQKNINSELKAETTSRKHPLEDKSEEEESFKRQKT